MIGKRILFSLILFVFGFLTVIGKAVYIQVINKDKLLAYSNSQFIRKSTIYPNRGRIFDRNGNPLAINVSTYSIFTMPKLHKDLSSYKKLVKIIPDLDLSDIKSKIKDRTRYTWLARKISLNEGQVKGIKKIEGIYVELEPSRLYPNNELLAQTLGFVGIDNKGLSGIEYEYDSLLKGKVTITKYLKDAKGRPVKLETTDLKSKGTDIYLTIDKEIQAVLEKHLKEAVVSHKALKGGAAVMDARTGEILAMANYPTFDPNNLTSKDTSYRKLSFVSDPFEPGSIFKTLTIASALDHNIVRPDTHYFCEYGRFQVGNHVIKEAEAKKHHEWLSVTDILRYSSNIGTTKIAFDLTYPKLKDSLTKFGIGEKTEIELPGESRGIMTSKENINSLSLSNISFGQGIATTGIQMLAAYATFANGGHYIRPTIIKNHENYKDERKPVKILSKKHVNEITQMLIEAVEDGTGANAKIPLFTIAGKTSTAQKPSQQGGYKEGAYIPGFIGFPVDVKNPFVIYVYVDEPQGYHYYGNSVAAPVFKKIAQYILYKNKEFKHLAAKNDISQFKNLDSINVKQSAIRMIRPNTTPNFIGLDKSSARALALKYGLKVEHKGFGIVKRQLPQPGGPFASDSIVQLFHEPPKYDE